MIKKRNIRLNSIQNDSGYQLRPLIFNKNYKALIFTEQATERRRILHWLDVLVNKDIDLLVPVICKLFYLQKEIIRFTEFMKKRLLKKLKDFCLCKRKKRNALVKGKRFYSYQFNDKIISRKTYYKPITFLHPSFVWLKRLEDLSGRSVARQQFGFQKPGGVFR